MKRTLLNEIKLAFGNAHLGYGLAPTRNTIRGQQMHYARFRDEVHDEPGTTAIPGCFKIKSLLTVQEKKNSRLSHHVGPTWILRYCVFVEQRRRKLFMCRRVEMNEAFFFILQVDSRVESCRKIKCRLYHDTTLLFVLTSLTISRTL